VVDITLADTKVTVVDGSSDLVGQQLDLSSGGIVVECTLSTTMRATLHRLGLLLVLAGMEHGFSPWHEQSEKFAKGN
jgi:hypothetical protein